MWKEVLKTAKAEREWHRNEPFLFRVRTQTAVFVRSDRFATKLGDEALWKLWHGANFHVQSIWFNFTALSWFKYHVKDVHDKFDLLIAATSELRLLRHPRVHHRDVLMIFYDISLSAYLLHRTMCLPSCSERAPQPWHFLCIPSAMGHAQGPSFFTHTENASAPLMFTTIPISLPLFCFLYYSNSSGNVALAA